MTDRNDKMIAAAAWLAEEGFAEIGWVATHDGKAPRRRWKSDATADPSLVPGLLGGARNSVVIPVRRGIIIDTDHPGQRDQLLADGLLPNTFTVASPTPGHFHIYGHCPDDVDIRDVPTSFTGGEVRRLGSGMVLGPWAMTTAGVYEPVHDAPTSLGTFSRDLIDHLRSSAKKRTTIEDVAVGPDDPGWQVIHGRHPFLLRRAVGLKRNGLSDETLLAELLRQRDLRCSAPGGREIDDDEVRRIAAEWVNNVVTEDVPGVT
jgi:hypothetical protein